MTLYDLLGLLGPFQDICILQIKTGDIIYQGSMIGAKRNTNKVVYLEAINDSLKIYIR